MSQHDDDCAAESKRQRLIYNTARHAPSASAPAAQVSPGDNVRNVKKHVNGPNQKPLARKHAAPNRHNANEFQHVSYSRTSDVRADEGITTIHGVLHRLPKNKKPTTTSSTGSGFRKGLGLPQPPLTESVDSSTRKSAEIQCGSASIDGAADSDSINNDVAWDRVFRALSAALSGNTTIDMLAANTVHSYEMLCDVTKVPHQHGHANGLHSKRAEAQPVLIDRPPLPDPYGGYDGSRQGGIALAATDIQQTARLSSQLWGTPGMLHDMDAFLDQLITTECI